MNQFENNPIGYYPDEMFFDEKTQTLKKMSSEKFIKKDEKIAENSQKNQKNGQNFAQNNIFNNFSGLFKGNEMIENMLKGGELKNNFLMQALSNLNSKKTKTEKQAVKNLNFEEEDYFEEL